MTVVENEMQPNLTAFSNATKSQAMSSQSLVDKKIFWKNVQFWYMLASIIAFTALARILYSNTSEIIIFIRSNSENADHAFFALNFFINLLLFSHLAFILISGLAKGNDPWPFEKSSYRFYVFLTLYELLTILCIIIVCMYDKFSAKWEVGEFQKKSKKDLHYLMALSDVQRVHKCCGFESFHDYFFHKQFVYVKNGYSRFSIPVPCCSENPCVNVANIPGNLTSYTIGCSEVISNYLDCYQKLIAFLLSLLAVVQFMLVLLSCKAKTIYKKQMTELSFKSELVLQESPLHHI